MKVELPINSKAKGKLARMKQKKKQEMYEYYYALIRYCKEHKCRSCPFWENENGCEINVPSSWEGGQDV